MLAIVYGYEVKDRDDPLVQLTEEINAVGSQSVLPGALLVNTFPLRASGLFYLNG